MKFLWMMVFRQGATVSPITGTRGNAPILWHDE
jgi:hypothetical protein